MNGPNKDPRLEGPERMLGGHATGNLSEREKQELFSAALEDQQLFNALMEEEALRDLLEQPGAKGELLDALQPREAWAVRLRRWLGTPMAWGAAGAVATAVVLVVMLVPRTDYRPAMQIAKQEAAPVAPQEAAEVTPAAPVPAPVPKAIPPQASRSREARQVAMARKVEGEAKTVMERDERRLADSAGQRAARNEAPPAVQQSQAVQQSPVQQDLQAPVPQQGFEQQAPRQDRQMQVQATGPAAAPIAEPAPAPQMAAAPPPRPALEYVLLKRNAQGAYAAATTFRESDAVRIQVTVHEEGYLSLTRRGESKPLVDVQAVRAGQIVQIPSSGFLLPSSVPYRLEFSPPPATPGRVGLIGGFRAGSSQAVGSSRAVKEELAKTKDAAAPRPVVIEILIRGSGN